MRWVLFLVRGVSLFDVRCVLSVGCGVLFEWCVCGLLNDGCNMLVVVRCSLFVVCCVLFVVCCLLLSVRKLLVVVRCVLSVVYCCVRFCL